MKTAIDWAAKPAPWNYIGAAWAIEVRRICGAKAAAAQLPDQQSMDLLGRRLRAKLTTRELAKRAGCAETTLCNLEHGRSTASREMWRRIDLALEAAAAAEPVSAQQERVRG